MKVNLNEVAKLSGIKVKEHAAIDESKVSDVMSKIDLSACSAYAAKFAISLIKAEFMENEAFNENMVEKIANAVTKAVGKDVSEDEMDDLIDKIFNKMLKAMADHCKQFKMTQ